MASKIASLCMSSMLFFFIFSATIAICQPMPSSSLEQNTPNNISQIFEDWITKHGRVYSNSEEKARRFEIFRAKYLYVQKFNKEGGEKLYTIGLNQFSDMTRRVFDYNKCRRHSGSFQTSMEMLATAGIKIFNSSLLHVDECNNPTDWSVEVSGDYGRYSPVGRVRDQGHECGACWAIASVAVAEATSRIRFIDEEQLPSLSVQQVLDCANGDRCEGGSEIDAYVYIMNNGGLATEEHYPYIGRNGTCDTEKGKGGSGGISGVVAVRPQTEENLKQAVCHGPVTAGIASNSWDFDLYEGGIFNGTCGPEVDRTVVVVGYGEDQNGVKFWKIQNSWGEGWGERGYMRMTFDAGKRCQIFSEASYPLL